MTQKASQEDIDEMTIFFQENKDKVTEMVQSGTLAVRKVHTALPELGRLIFFHDDETKQRLAKWIEENSGSGNAEGHISAELKDNAEHHIDAEYKDDSEDADNNETEPEEKGWQRLIKKPGDFEAF